MPLEINTSGSIAGRGSLLMVTNKIQIRNQSHLVGPIPLPDHLAHLIDIVKVGQNMIDIKVSQPSPRVEFAINALTAWLLIHYFFITAAIAAFAALLAHR